MDPSPVIPSLRAVVAGLDPSLPVFDVRTMDDHPRSGQALLVTRLGSAFATVFGLLALALATAGVYGVVSYSVATMAVVSSVLYGVGPRDPVVFGIVVGLLTLVVAIPSLVPARRAVRIDPITSLRSQ